MHVYIFFLSLTISRITVWMKITLNHISVKQSKELSWHVFKKTVSNWPVAIGERHETLYINLWCMTVSNYLKHKSTYKSTCTNIWFHILHIYIYMYNMYFMHVLHIKFMFLIVTYHDQINIYRSLLYMKLVSQTNVEINKVSSKVTLNNKQDC